MRREGSQGRSPEVRVDYLNIRSAFRKVTTYLRLLEDTGENSHITANPVAILTTT